MSLKRIGRSLAVVLAATMVISAAIPAAATEVETQLHTAAETHTETPSEPEPSESKTPSEKPAESEKPQESEKTQEPEKATESENSGEHTSELPSTEDSGNHETEQPGIHESETPSTETPGHQESETQSSEIPDIDLPGIDLPVTEFPDFDPDMDLNGTETGPEENLIEEAFPEGMPEEELGEDPNFDMDEEITEEETLLNEDLINLQNIVMPELTELTEEFRFTLDPSAVRIILKKGARVYEETLQTAQVIGRSYTGSVAYILDEIDVDKTDAASGENRQERWYYIESGSVRGYVPENALITGLDAAAILLDEEAVAKFRDAECTVRPVDNQALTHSLKTAYEPVVDKVYAVANCNISILSARNPSEEDIQVLGTLPKGGLAYILADQESEMVYVESNDVRGFVPAADLTTGDQAEAVVKKQGENNMKLAEQKVPVSENPVLYYTLTSIKKADGKAALRKAMVEYALQFLGNPYVWGGTSLTSGTDCSGFVMQIYKQFGYTLPRTSIYQSKVGMQIPISAAIPGDLIFFAKDGVVYHVAMYIGNGKMVHAKGKAYGIVVDDVSQRAVWATRIIQ